MEVEALDRIIEHKPRGGWFTTDAWVQRVRHCSPCDAGSSCPRCEDEIWLSQAFGAFKDPLSPNDSLALRVPDARLFSPIDHVRVTFVVRGSSDARVPFSAVLSGFTVLPR